MRNIETSIATSAACSTLPSKMCNFWSDGYFFFYKFWATVSPENNVDRFACF